MKKIIYILTILLASSSSADAAVAKATRFVSLASATSATSSTSASPDSVVRPIYSHFVLKNNLLYDAVLTPNITAEWPIGRRWTMAVTGGFNPFWHHAAEKNHGPFHRGKASAADDRTQWRHLLVMPELRWWFGKPKGDKTQWATSDGKKASTSHLFYRNFLSFNMLYTHYNTGNVRFPLNAYKTVRDYRLEGDAVAVGMSVGHVWSLGRHFYLEADLGADVGYAWYDRYDCTNCGAKFGKNDKPFVMPKAGLSLVYQFGKKKKELPEPEPVVEPEPERVIEVQKPPFRPTTTAVFERTGVAGQLAETHDVLQHISKYRPYDETRILRKEKGALYVHFPLDKTTLLHDFRDNAATLDQIIDITRLIMADTTSAVKCIQVIGLASIEGNQPHNKQLAGGRALALQRYVQKELNLPDSLFETVNGGEAWSEFRDQINDLVDNGQKTTDNGAKATGDAPSREALQELLTIIDTESDLDRREQRIKRLNGGRTYQWLKKNVLADQRNSGYVRIYWDYVPDESARIINRASILINKEQYAEALELLQSVRGDIRSYNALATALYMTGQREEAIHYYRLAAQNGNAQAKRNLEEIEKERK